MGELDPWAERELANQIAGNSWSGRSVPGRIGLTLAIAAPTTLIVAGIAFLARPEWWWAFAAASALAIELALMPYVVAPEATIRFFFRMTDVSNADARKPPPTP